MNITSINDANCIYTIFEKCIFIPVEGKHLLNSTFYNTKFSECKLFNNENKTNNIYYLNLDKDNGDPIKGYMLGIFYIHKLYILGPGINLEDSELDFLNKKKLKEVYKTVEDSREERFNKFRNLLVDPAFQVDISTHPLNDVKSKGKVDLYLKLPANTINFNGWVLGPGVSSTGFKFNSDSDPDSDSDSDGLPDLSLEQYASLCVERALYPGNDLQVAERYKLLTAEALQKLDASWRKRFAAEGNLQARWQQAYSQYEAWLRGHK